MHAIAPVAAVAAVFVAPHAFGASANTRGLAAQRASLALRETAVVVNAGQTLTEADLAAGLFDGQSFNLDAETTFDIRDGGVIGPVGDSTVNPIIAFDFNGSTVNLNDGGRFTGIPSASESSIVANVLLNIFEGATVDDRFWAYSSHVNFTGGMIGDGFRMRNGGTVSMSGGAIGRFATADTGSVWNISGGIIDSYFTARDATVTVSGGNMGNAAALNGGTCNISGGAIGSSLLAWSGGIVNLTAGSIGDQFDLEGATLHMTGGSIGDHFDVNADSVANIAGGTVGSNVRVSDATVNISGGTVGDDFDAWVRSEVNITGGTIGNGFSIYSIVNFSGGTIGIGLDVFRFGVLNISGGSLIDGLRALGGSEVNLFVTDIAIGGMPIDLQSGETVEIIERSDALLEATLADGSYLAFNLDSINPYAPGELIGATLTVTYIPAPGAATLLALAGLLTTRRRR